MTTWRDCLVAGNVHSAGAREDYAAAARYLRRREPALYTAIRLVGWDEYQPHAVAGYAFASFTDDLCDYGTPPERALRLDAWRREVTGALESGTAPHPLLRAYVGSVRERGMPHRWVHAYLDGAGDDLDFQGFADEADHQAYIDRLSWPFAMITADLVHRGGGSEHYARCCRLLADLWQRTDFLVDLHQDLRGGRLYLPADALAHHGVTRGDLESRSSSGRVRALVHATADTGLALARQAFCVLEEMPGPMRPLVRFMIHLARLRLERVRSLGAGITRRPVGDRPVACLRLLSAARSETRRVRARRAGPDAGEEDGSGPSPAGPSPSGPASANSVAGAGTRAGAPVGTSPVAARDPAPDPARDASAATEALRRALAEETAARWPTHVEGMDAIHHYALIPSGKLLRPLLLCHSAMALGAELDQVLPAAVGFECAHVGSLVHDDILDEDAVRRGKPAVHTAYGPGKALLAGNALLFMWFRGLAECAERGVDRRRITDALSVQARAGVEICRGMVDELAMAGDLGCGTDAYLDMARRKTAVLLAAACRVGAILADAPPDVQDRLSAYGEALGIAFQIRDDLIPYLAPGDGDGKPAASDVRNGRPTYPVLLALESADGATRTAVRQVLTDRSDPAAARLRMGELLGEAGALAAARTAAEGYGTRARQALHGLPESPHLSALRLLTRPLPAARRAGSGAPATGREPGTDREPGAGRESGAGRALGPRHGDGAPEPRQGAGRAPEGPH